MVVLSGPAAAILGALSYINSLVSEPWTRYFIIMLGLVADNAVGNYTGIYVLEGLITLVVTTFFWQGFYIPVIYGVSLLLVFTAFYPLLFHAITANE